MKPQVFVVEGKNDIAKLKRLYPNINVVGVNGSETNQDTIDYLKTINNTHEIILCMDPDYPGKQIRTKLENELNNVSHIFFNRKTAKSKNKKKIGLEHIDDEILKAEINNIIKFSEGVNNLEINDLFDLKLIGHKNSKEKRLKLTNYLKIDNCNGKRLLNRLNSLGIAKDKLNEIVINL